MLRCCDAAMLRCTPASHMPFSAPAFNTSTATIQVPHIAMLGLVLVLMLVLMLVLIMLIVLIVLCC
jgi:hypothetical protein